jgi:sRNA-binding protein
MNVMDRDDLDRAIEALCEMYPKAFFANPRLRRPLKHNIVKDIKADLAEDPESELRFYDIDQAFAWYCGHVSYHKACSVAGTARLNLAGNKAGTVTETEARDAGERATELFGQIEANKRTRGVSATLNRPTTPTVPAVKPLTVDTALSDDDLVASVEKHFAALKTVRDLPDPTLQKQLSRTVLLLMMDELKTLDARLSA